MEHFYQSIDGWTKNRYLMFDKVIKLIKSDCIWVEVGAWQGKSVAYCAVELINQGKFGKFYAVDSWDGGIDLQDYKIVKRGKLKETFLENMKPLGNKIESIESLSWDGAQHFDKESIDFCYIDAGHTYDCVKKDLEAWYPKVKKESYFGGDDYGYEVKLAVDEFVKKENLELEEIGACWLLRKP